MLEATRPPEPPRPYLYVAEGGEALCDVNGRLQPRSDAQTLTMKAPTYQFGPFELRPGSGLFRGEEPVRVPPKELGLLTLLIRLGGDVASHEQIEAQLWPGRDVSYASLTRCVYSLRKILDEDDLSYIETVPRRGYRIAVPVERVKDPARSVSLDKSVEAAPQAYSHYLEGLREANLWNPDSQARAVELFELAHRVDPSYATPLAAVADCHIYQAIVGHQPPVDADRVGRSACERALEIDGNLAPALAALGWLDGLIRRDLEGGLTLVDQALEIDPSYARGHSYRAWILRSAGRRVEGVDAARSAVEMDPHSVLTRHALAWTLCCAGEVDEALVIERAICRESPRHELGHAHRAVYASVLGFHGEALAAGREAVRLSNGDPTIKTALSYALANAGEAGEARALADEAAAAVLPRALRPHLAMTYVALGDTGRALELLREARSERSPWFLGARFDPRLGSLADDPAVRALYD